MNNQLTLTEEEKSAFRTTPLTEVAIDIAINAGRLITLGVLEIGDSRHLVSMIKEFSIDFEEKWHKLFHKDYLDAIDIFAERNILKYYKDEINGRIIGHDSRVVKLDYNDAKFCPKCGTKTAVHKRKVYIEAGDYDHTGGNQEYDHQMPGNEFSCTSCDNHFFV